MDQGAPKPGIYAAALVLTIACLALATVAIGWLGELAGVRAGRPAAAALFFVQGVAGALLAGFASRQLFKSLRPADFWLKWIVVIFGAVFAVAILWLLATGRSDGALNWTTYSGVAALIGIEIGRRAAKGLFGRSGPGDVAASPS